MFWKIVHSTFLIQTTINSYSNCILLKQPASHPGIVCYNKTFGETCREQWNNLWEILWLFLLLIQAVITALSSTMEVSLSPFLLIAWIWQAPEWWHELSSRNSVCLLYLKILGIFLFPVAVFKKFSWYVLNKLIN